jgi:hypothetical protein
MMVKPERPTSKTCCDCKVDKPIREFQKSPKCKDGRHKRCKVCERAREKRKKVELAEYGKKYFTF